MSRRERRRQERSLKKSASASPDEAGAHYNLGNAHLGRGKLDEAIACYRRALEIDPDFAAVHNNLGNAFGSQGMPDEEIACYRRVIAIDPEYLKAHYNLGNALRDHGEPDEAIACYRRALEIDSEYADAHNNLGNLLRDRDELDEAIACYHRAIEIDLNHTMAHYNLAISHRKQGKLDEAIFCYRYAIAIDPEFAMAHYELGKALKDQGKLRKATACFRRAVEINPDIAMAHYDLGKALKGQGKLRRATACFRRAVEIDPDFAMAHFELGRVLHDREKHDDTIECFERVIAIDPDFAAAHLGIGNALRQQGKSEEAILRYRRAIEIDPNYADGYNNLGNALLYLDKWEEAGACTRRALEIDPSHVNARLNYANAHKFFPGDPELERLKALGELTHLSEDNRNRLMFCLGKAHDDMGLYAEAFSYYSRANEEMAQRREFDPAKYRREVSKIVDAFPERRGSLAENSAKVPRVPIFVVGMSRSGKSLVESLLKQHGETFDAGERFEWFRAVKRVLKKHAISESYPDCMDVLTDGQIAEIGELYMNDISKYSPGSRFFINTLPGNVKYIGLIFQALPAARVVYCHRDPLDQCLFVYFYRYARATNRQSYELRTTALGYADYHTLMGHWEKLYGDRILSVRYEELVQNAEEVSARIFDYCGIQYDPAAIHHAFTTDEIGIWKNYEPYLGPLREALGKLAG